MHSGVYKEELRREAERLRLILANAELLRVTLRARTQFDPSMPLVSVERRISTEKAPGSISFGEQS